MVLPKISRVTAIRVTHRICTAISGSFWICPLASFGSTLVWALMAKQMVVSSPIIFSDTTVSTPVAKENHEDSGAFRS